METTENIKTCCATLYQSDWARIFLGDSFHPGGLALTRRLGTLLDLKPDQRGLDVAAGPGSSAIFLAQQFGCQAVGMENWLRGMDSVDVYGEFATFESTNTVRVGDEVIEAETIVINAGGRPRLVPIPGIDEVDWLDNARLLDLPALPRQLAIVGGSYISLEFAQAFRRLGSEVTILEAGSQLMFREDADIANTARDILEGEGITIHLNVNVKRLAQEAPEKIAFSSNKTGSRSKCAVPTCYWPLAASLIATVSIWKRPGLRSTIVVTMLSTR